MILSELILVLSRLLFQKDSCLANLAIISYILNRAIIKDILIGLSILYSFLRVLTLI
jgi:hypothetical protein